MAKISKFADLNRRIEITRESTILDEYKDRIVVDEVVYTLWAKMLSQMLSEVKANVGTNQKDTVTFVVRYNQMFQISTDMKVNYNNRKYNIIKYTPDETFKEFSTIVCEVTN